MRRLRWKTVIALLALNALMVGAFQNCSQLKYGNKGSAPTQSSVSGNGENYDGKPYVFHDAAEPCAGADKANFRVLETDTGYLLSRENCQDITPPRDISPADITVNPVRPALLTYRSAGGDIPLILDAEALSRAQNPVLICVGRDPVAIESVNVYSVESQGQNILVGLGVRGSLQFTVAFDGDSAVLAPGLTLNGVNETGDTTFNLRNYNAQSTYPNNCNMSYLYRNANTVSDNYLSCRQVAP